MAMPTLKASGKALHTRTRIHAAAAAVTMTLQTRLSRVRCRRKRTQQPLLSWRGSSALLALVLSLPVVRHRSPSQTAVTARQAALVVREVLAALAVGARLGRRLRVVTTLLFSQAQCGHRHTIHSQLLTRWPPLRQAHRGQRQQLCTLLRLQQLLARRMRYQRRVLLQRPRLVQLLQTERLPSLRRAGVRIAERRPRLPALARASRLHQAELFRPLRLWMRLALRLHVIRALALCAPPSRAATCQLLHPHPHPHQHQQACTATMLMMIIVTMTITMTATCLSVRGQCSSTAAAASTA